MEKRMRLTLNVPETMPRWATDVGATIEPSSGKKDTGTRGSEKMPARWYNWLINNLYQWVQANAAVPISNWFLGDDEVGSADPRWFVLYHPTYGLWITCDGTDVLVSVDGVHFVTSTSGSLSTSIVNAHPTGIDLTRYLVGQTNGDIDYSVDPDISWSTDSSTGLSNDITAICTKYPTSNLAIIGDELGTLKIAASGVGTAWVSPTTPPYTPGAGLKIYRIIWLTGDVWVLVAQNGTPDYKTYISTDNGDNWAATTTQPKSALSTPGDWQDTKELAHNPDAGTLVAVCRMSTGAYVYPALCYSSDNGVTWTEATIYRHDLYVDIGAAADETISLLHYCGGGLWLAMGFRDVAAGVGGSVGYASADDGLTWKPVTFQLDTTATNQDGLGTTLDIACDGKHLVSVGDEQFSLHSLGIAGSAGA